MNNISIIDAPSNLGLKPSPNGKLSGVIRLPDALNKAGLRERLGAEYEGQITVPPYSPERDKELLVLNAYSIRDFSLRLASKVEDSIRRERFPLVLGGDCSILLGNLLALKRLGRYGLFFIDGHTDFLELNGSQTGGVAGMDLALATGRGAELLTNIEGSKPLVLEQDVVVFGYRDMEEASLSIQDLSETDMTLYNLHQVRRLGIKQAAARAIQKLKNNNLSGFWIHLDADVLDDEIMPAVDSRQPGGMSYGELSELLRILLSSGSAVGMHIGIFDPDMDFDGTITQAFSDALVDGFTLHAD
ncbi:MAG: arginase family protein [Acidobacteriota bacterium]|nr:arginase family protein [Acidobacteriota bacterium]